MYMVTSTLRFWTISSKAKQIIQSNATAGEVGDYIRRSPAWWLECRLPEGKKKLTKCSEHCLHLSLSYAFWKEWQLLTLGVGLWVQRPFILTVKSFIYYHIEGKSGISTVPTRNKLYFFLSEIGWDIKDNCLIVLSTYFHFKKIKGRGGNKYLGFYYIVRATRGQQISTFLTLAPDNLIFVVAW